MGHWAKTALARERERLQRQLRLTEHSRQSGQLHLRQLATADRMEREGVLADSRARTVERMNRELAEVDKRLASILERAPRLDYSAYFEGLKLPLGPEDQAEHEALSTPPRYEPPAPPKGLKRLRPGAKREFEERALQVQSEYARDLRDYWDRHESRRRRDLADQSTQGRSFVHIREQHRKVEAFKTAVKAGDPAALVDLLAVVLVTSHYPEGFPNTFTIAFEADVRRVVVDFELPPPALVPAAERYTYDASSDEIQTASRALPDRDRTYRQIVGATALRTICELFEVDRAGTIETVVFNGLRRDGNIHDCAISVQATREAFERVLDLRQPDAADSLQRLDARLPATDNASEGVEPLLSAQDVQTPYVVATATPTADGHPANLLEIDELEFEALVGALFEKMGLQIERSRVLGDGEIECVAVDPRPLFGGRVLIHASQTTNNVGIRALRDQVAGIERSDLAKAIVISTSGFTRSSVRFAKSEPIELLSGKRLIELLQEHLDVEAVIEASPDLELAGSPTAT